MAGKKTRATMRQHGSWLIYNHMGNHGRSLKSISLIREGCRSNSAELRQADGALSVFVHSTGRVPSGLTGPVVNDLRLFRRYDPEPNEPNATCVHCDAFPTG